MSFSEVIAPLLGRLAIGWYLLDQTWAYAMHWGDTVAWVTAHNMPAPEALLALAIFLAALAALGLIFGFQSKHAAMGLFAFNLFVAVTLHNFWDMQGAARADAYRLFSHDVLVMGALLLMVGMGPGRFAMDNSGKKKGPR